MNKDEDVIYYDFQGWPVYKENLREILEELGAITENGVIGFKIDNPVLDIYPVVYHDDGMAYGVDPRYITAADIDVDDKYINIFAESERNNKDGNINDKYDTRKS